ncbi:AraC family transcriptional regulator [Blastococcus sp. CT_GayMR20]|nr:AraC family transcriptional regulator [Blastococcus sp. CT_GayMR20]
MLLDHIRGTTGGSMGAEPLGRFPAARTSDCDEAQEAMAATFLPLRMRMLERPGPGGVGMRLNALRVGDVTVAYARFGGAVEVATAEAENYHVDLPISGTARFRTGRLQSVEGTPRRAAVFMPGDSAAIDWSGGCEQFCLMFPRAMLQRELEAMLDRPLAEPLVFAQAMDVSTAPGGSWLDTLRLVERQARYAHSLLDHPLAAAHLAQTLAAGLLLGQPHNYTDALDGPRRPAAPQAVREAVELIDAHPEDPWTTASLARRVAVSARSLQEGFARSYGVPPSAYLRSVRLDRAHAELLAADPHTTTVANVAGRWGFLYLSRFAASYREKFGENPSATLRSP